MHRQILEVGARAAGGGGLHRGLARLDWRLLWRLVWRPACHPACRPLRRPRLARLAAAAALAGLTGLAPGLQAAPATPPDGGCAAGPGPVLERFIDARCAECWQQATAQAGSAPDTPPAVQVLDWIVPAGDAAALALAALPEAAERLQRLGLPPPATATAVRQAGAAAQPPGLALQARAGPAWLGRTMAFEFRLRAASALPPGASGWLAMVEEIPAGREGSPLPRSLLRNLAGPLPLPTLAPTSESTHAPGASPSSSPGATPDTTPGAAPAALLSHLRAMRWPEGAEPTRLRARAWVEDAQGRLLAYAAEGCGPTLDD